MSEHEKPFWLNPPYVVLFDLLRLHRLRPWDINIASLLNNFLSEMSKSGFIDFTISGTALLSSATIHRMKSDLVLKMEDAPKQPEPKSDEIMPPPLPFPIRYEYTSVSVEDILRALRQTLDQEMQASTSQRREMLLPAILTEHLDEFLTDIDSRLEEFYLELVRLARKSKALSFYTINRKKPVLEKIRRFILLLFLACQGRVSLLQERDDSDIEITIQGIATRAGAV
jgi:segregation and condensation protein A